MFFDRKYFNIIKLDYFFMEMTPLDEIEETLKAWKKKKQQKKEEEEKKEIKKHE